MQGQGKCKIALFGDCGSHGIASNIEHTRAIGLINWVSIVAKSPVDGKISMALLDETPMTNYEKRVTLLDAQKEVLDYLLQEKADYLLLDCNDCRLGLLLNKTSQEMQCITSHEFMKGFKRVQKEISDISGGNFEILAPYDIDIGIYQEAVKKICGRIREVYTPEKIILHKHFFADEYVEKNRVCRFVRTSKYQNSKAENLIREIYGFIESELPGCHVIEFPEYVVGDSNHPLGVHPLHYHKMYYEYGSRAIELITEKYPDEKKRLAQLREIYSLRMKLESIRLKSNYEIQCLKNRFIMITSCMTMDNVSSKYKLLKKTSDILSFFDLLFLLRRDIIVCAAVRDTPGTRMPVEIKERFHDFGFANLQTKLWMMYVGVIYRGDILVDRAGEKPGQEVSEKLCMGNLKIELQSQAYQKGNKASIQLNGMEYSKNMRGINMVVLNADTHEVMDAITYDSHDLQDYFRRGIE